MDTKIQYSYGEEVRQCRISELNSDWLMRLLMDPSLPTLIIIPACILCQIIAVVMTIFQVSQKFWFKILQFSNLYSQWFIIQSIILIGMLMFNLAFSLLSMLGLLAITPVIALLMDYCDQRKGKAKCLVLKILSKLMLIPSQALWKKRNRTK